MNRLDVFDSSMACTEGISDLGDYFRMHAQDLTDEWEQEALLAGPRHATHEQRAELRDRLPHFLVELGNNLKAGTSAIPKSFAIEHGTQRWGIGWDIEYLVRDFMLLRRVLVRRLRHSLNASYDDVIAIVVALDEAVAASVSAYVAERDRELREHNSHLERNNEQLRHFAHVLAHELQNPLALIEMAAQELTSRLFLGASNARQLVTNLLAFAKADSPALQKSEIDLQQVAREIVERLRYRIAETHASVHWGSLPIVHGNHRLIAQALENLVENAIKYGRDGVPPEVRIVAQERETQWVISVEDNGVGIPMDQQARIFEFLNRANSNGKVSGTGIGLALCKRVIECHGGSIGVESIPGCGTRFLLTLPKV